MLPQKPSCWRYLTRDISLPFSFCILMRRWEDLYFSPLLTMMTISTVTHWHSNTQAQRRWSWPTPHWDLPPLRWFPLAFCHIHRKLAHQLFHFCGPMMLAVDFSSTLNHLVSFRIFSHGASESPSHPSSHSARVSLFFPIHVCSHLCPCCNSFHSDVSDSQAFVNWPKFLPPSWMQQFPFSANSAPVLILPGMPTASFVYCPWHHPFQHPGADPSFLWLPMACE